MNNKTLLIPVAALMMAMPFSAFAYNVMQGSAGNDTIQGTNGDDLIIGGAENDFLSGNSGSDKYYFEWDFGQDIVANYDYRGEKDVIEFGSGILPENFRVTRYQYDLYLKMIDGTDQVRLTDYFQKDGINDFAVDEIVFSNGTVWDVETVKRLALIPTDGDEYIYGYATDDVLHGGAGNDDISGNEGDDILYGDEGKDRLHGGNGNDFLYGGAGNDTLNGNNGDDYFDGGEGDDYLDGGRGRDTFYLSYGWGVDTVAAYNDEPNVKDVVLIENVPPAFFGDLAMLSLTRTTWDLSIWNKHTQGSGFDRVVIGNYFMGDNYQPEIYINGELLDKEFIEDYLSGNLGPYPSQVIRY